MSVNELEDNPNQQLEVAVDDSSAGAPTVSAVEAPAELSSPAEEAVATPSAPEGSVVEPAEPGGADAELLSSLTEQVESLARLVEESNRLAQERERIIDRLHEENQRLRQGELQQAILPIFRDLVRLYDDLKQTTLGYGSRAEVTPEQAARDFGCFAEMVTDILYRHGVERYEAREGDLFNPKEHRVLGAVTTPEQVKDRTIARSIRDGFRTETRPVRLLEAEVYRYAAGVDAGRDPEGGAPKVP